MEKETNKDSVQIQDVTERIKTFEDACEEIGEGRCMIEEYKNITQRTTVISKSLLAYLKLRIITAALNEEWEPQYNTEEECHWPLFTILKDEEYIELREKKKEWIKKFIIKRGMCYVMVGSAPLSANLLVNSALAFKSMELAVYAVKQFYKLYADFFFNGQEECGK